ncbi:MAG: hypothetical protein M3033_15160 [Acidobacteriota bacterium]|nr:hypothetical protein [Acidobacteriota bacterium]
MFQPIEFNRSAVRAGDCISDGLALIQPKYFLFLGIIIVGLIIGGCIPCVSIFLAGPIAVGIFYALFTQMRGQTVDFGMLFKGFEKFVPAMVIGIIASLPEIIGEGFRLTTNVADLGAMMGNKSSFAAQSSPNFALSAGLILLFLVIALAAIIFSFAWKVTFFFALPLIAEHNLDIGEALKLSSRAGWSNWGGLLLLFIFQFLVALVGVLMLCIGIFFVMPIIQASSAVAFRQVFPDNQQQQFNNEPPRPEAYGGTYGTPQ